MTIKRLIKDKFPSTNFLITENEAILLFSEGEEQVCLYLKQATSTEILKLKQFISIDNFRFIGDKKVFELISESGLNWPPPSRKIFIEKDQEVVYYSESGKVRFKKDALSKATPKRVLIIDDSKTIQKLLSRIIGESEKLELIGVADCPSEARKIIEENHQIDLITLDIHMPEMNGVDFLKTYLAAKNIPIVMISSVSINEGPLVMEALSSGAYTYIQKPSLEKLSDVKIEILEKLEAVASIARKEKKHNKKFLKSKFNHFDGLIAIGSSTGGTQALQEIFTSLPDEIPPFVVVQHIPAVFSKALAERLNTLCPFTVKEAEDGEFLQKNFIYIAPGGKQMKVLKKGQKKMITITDDPPLNRFQPSVDYLFNTLPALKEKNILGVILTGMGKDGARGLLELKNSGAITIAQDEESSIVFGMPKEAIAIGAAEKIVSLPDMALNIISEFNKLFKNKAA